MGRPSTTPHRAPHTVTHLAIISHEAHAVPRVDGARAEVALFYPLQVRKGTDRERDRARHTNNAQDTGVCKIRGQHTARAGSTGTHTHTNMQQHGSPSVRCLDEASPTLCVCVRPFFLYLDWSKSATGDKSPLQKQVLARPAAWRTQHAKNGGFFAQEVPNGGQCLREGAGQLAVRLCRALLPWMSGSRPTTR